MLALVVASRFGLLLGLAMWLGLGVALVLACRWWKSACPAPKARELGDAITARLDVMLYVAVGCGDRRLARGSGSIGPPPPAASSFPVAVMTLARLLWR